MAKLYLFGIGGTGSRVLRSLSMMMAAGVRLGVDEVVPVIIDYDLGNADLTRTVDLQGRYVSIQQKLENESAGFFHTRLVKPLQNYTLQVEGNDLSFRQFIELSSMDRANQALVKMLFSEANLEGPMNVGFKGNPHIGSVVLNQIAQSKEFEALANSFEQGDKIFIISSIFGGTGASGFPLLLKTLRLGDAFSKNALLNAAEIGAVTLLPYFQVERDEQSAIDSSTFISKAKSALAYYEKSICQSGQINALYYLADDVTNMYDNHEGATAQRNAAHLIEFMAATAIVDFSHKNHPQTVHKELGVRDLSKESVSFADLYGRLTEWLHQPLTQFAMMALCLRNQFDFVSSNRLRANERHRFDPAFYRDPFVQELRRFLDDYRGWLGELSTNKRALRLFNLECGNKPFELLVDRKPEKVWSLKSDYELFFDRLNRASADLRGNNRARILVEMFYRATRQLTKEKFAF